MEDYGIEEYYYVSNNMEKFFAPEDMPLDDDCPDSIQELLTSEETLKEITELIKKELEKEDGN